MGPATCLRAREVQFSQWAVSQVSFNDIVCMCYSNDDWLQTDTTEFTRELTRAQTSEGAGPVALTGVHLT